MNMKEKIVFIFVMLLFFSCDIEDNAVTNNSYIVNQGDTIRVRRLVESHMDYNYIYNNVYLTAQGASIYNNHLYRFYDYGLCKVFRMDRIYTSYVSKYKLKSFHEGNHVNCAQIDKSTGLLYESEFYERKCNVERISETGSEFVQTIKIENQESIPGSYLNIVKGDDGYLWAFGCMDSGAGPLYFYKFNLPSTDIAEVSLSEKDLVDKWTDFNDICMQGGIVRKGYLFFLSGSSNAFKKLLIYDTKNKSLFRSIDLTDIIPEEPEDCDFIEDEYEEKLIVTVYGSNAYYVLNLTNLFK